MCQYCPQKFKTYFSLKSHMSIHKDEQVSGARDYIQLGPYFIFLARCHVTDIQLW